MSHGVSVAIPRDKVSSNASQCTNMVLDQTMEQSVCIIVRQFRMVISVAGPVIQFSASGYAALDLTHCCQRKLGVPCQSWSMRLLEAQMHGIWVMQKLSVHAQA